MKIFFISFSVMFSFIAAIYLATVFIDKKNEDIKIKIEKWDLKGDNIVMELSFEIESPVYMRKNLLCQTFDKNEKRLSIVRKKLRGDLKESFVETIEIGPVSRKTQFIDCSFVEISDN